jgi:hypothetical protein
MRRGMIQTIVFGGAFAFATVAAQAANVNLFNTQEDFTGWTNGGGSPVSTWGPNATDYDGVTLNGIGNTTAPAAPGTAGSLQLNTGSNAIGYTFTAFSPNELNNAGFMSAFDPGTTPGNTVAYSGTLYLTYSVPAFVGTQVYYQVGVDISYPGNSYYGLFFESALSSPTTVNGVSWVTATIPYSLVASSGGSLTISPSFNAGVYGTGVAGTDNVLTGPIYFDNFQVPSAVTPEPASIAGAALFSLCLTRRRRTVGTSNA